MFSSWSAWLDSVRPIVEHYPKIIKALKVVKDLNLTSACRSQLNVIVKYMKSFKCVLLSQIWFRLLTPIDKLNFVLQALASTIDWEVKNLDSLNDKISEIKGQWQEILTNAKSSALTYKIEPILPEKRTIIKRTLS